MLAGFTSLISILEVVISAVKDKLGWGRWTATAVVGLSGAVSLSLFSTTTGVQMLDTMDAFANNFGIVGAALMSVVLVMWVARRGGRIVSHLNSVSSFRLGRGYQILLGVVMPLLLAWMWISWILKTMNEGYEGYPADFLGLYGWGLAIGSVVLAVLLSLIPWSRKSSLHAEQSTHEHDDDDLVPATQEA